MTTQVKGTRRFDVPRDSDDTLNPGDYYKDYRGHWIVVAPVARDSDGFLLTADVSTWNVTEHEDQTITVSPSVFWGAGGYPNSPKEWAQTHTWHGFLENGVWRSV